MKRFASIVLLAASVFAAPLLASAADTPDATISLAGRTVAAGVGVSHAKGTLQYRGQSYPVDLQGLSVVAVGASAFTATGDVYHLTKPSDLNGNYVAASAGAALADGGTATTLKNENGVLIRLRSTDKGVQFNLSVESVTLKLTQPQ
jgi:hypothetical protein